MSPEPAPDKPALTDEGRAAIRRARILMLPIRVMLLLLLVTLPAGGVEAAWAVEALQPFLVAFVVMIAFERAGITVDPSAPSQDRGSKLTLVVAVFISVLLAVRELSRGLPGVPEALRPTESWLVRGAALALVASGLALRQWAMATLGRFFTDQVRIFEGHRIVREGPYRFVRHPSYAGLALIMVGLPLSSGSLVATAVGVTLGFLSLAFRIRVEEAALNKAFGPAYAEYAARTARLVPGLL
ncbi:MAG: isoprenylcysteine carboxylmethyltransferase family protein [Myxococcota bacterium]